MQTLDKYQEEGARFLATAERGAFLADEPGEVGKTLQAIRACDLVGARNVLVITPPSVKENWRRYFDDSSLLDPALDIYTHKTLEGAGLKDRYDVIIADEAHYFKAPRSARTRMFYGDDVDGGPDSIVSRGKRVFLLSGSPAPNHPGELWPHLHALRPDLIMGPKGPLPALRFTNIFCNVVNGPFGPKIMGVRDSKVGRLRSILAEFMLRRKHGMVPLPDLCVEPLFVEPGTNFTRWASEDAERVQAALDKGGVEALAEIATGLSNLRRLLGLAKIWPAQRYVKDWLDANDGKLTVYAWHTEVIQRLRDYFPGAASIDGSTTDRQAQVDRFQNDDACRVFIGQMQAAGEAITLTRASETLIVEPSWVPKDNWQTIKRVHRRGQTRPCLARFMTVAGSVDESINRVLARKQAMQDAVFDEAAA